MFMVSLKKLSCFTILVILVHPLYLEHCREAEINVCYRLYVNGLLGFLCSWPWASQKTFLCHIFYATHSFVFIASSLRLRLCTGKVFSCMLFPRTLAIVCWVDYFVVAIQCPTWSRNIPMHYIVNFCLVLKVSPSKSDCRFQPVTACALWKWIK